MKLDLKFARIFETVIRYFKSPHVRFRVLEDGTKDNVKAVVDKDRLKLALSSPRVRPGGAGHQDAGATKWCLKQPLAFLLPHQ